MSIILLLISLFTAVSGPEITRGTHKPGQPPFDTPIHFRAKR